jgi:hypothetical protein
VVDPARLENGVQDIPMRGFVGMNDGAARNPVPRRFATFQSGFAEITPVLKRFASRLARFRPGGCKAKLSFNCDQVKFILING